MTYLTNDPARFAEQALAGFAAAHPGHVLAVPGGVVRATAAPGQVAIVMGGGTGHFPAFAGWVGPGLGHGAACGDVFASPSSERVYAVAKAADNGAGIAFLVINYAGDVLNFSVAAEQLRAEGIDARVVTVTDDIASGGTDERDQRRGIAGALVVHKVAGAAAEAGRSLDDVVRVAEEANARTATLGIAVTGCTLPGAEGPLFRLPEGSMGIGLGIHGEAGLSEQPLPSADDTADLLVDAVLDDLRPASDALVAVVLNGLGAASHEELYLSYRRVAERLRDVGLTLVAPAVGEFVTSLEMAGYSLSLTVLTPELEELWLAPVDTPILHRGTASSRGRRELPPDLDDTAPDVTEGTPASRRSAVRVVAWLAAITAALTEHEDELGDLDAVAGDGDHGAGMRHGAESALAAARRAAEQGTGARTTLNTAAHAWSGRAGGTSGALWGAGLAALAGRLGDDEEVTFARLVAGWRAFADTVTSLGGAQQGDKTMVDALLPFVEALEAADDTAEPDAAWHSAAEAASAAARATADIAAERGRARAHGDRSIGTPDPGATSFALVVSAVRPSLGADDSALGGGL